MDYESMSDFEINKAVAEIQNPDAKKIFQCDRKGIPISEGVNILLANGINGKTKDYCNKPDDAWPIINENHISIHCCPNTWYHVAFLPESAGYFSFGGGKITQSMDVQYTLSSVCANPLRAAMIVFLMVQEPK